MSGKISLLSEAQAQTEVFQRLKASAGLKVMLFQGLLKKFVTHLYAKNYVFGQLDVDANMRLALAFASGKNPIVSKIEFFRAKTAMEILLAQAELAGLPVAAVKIDLEKFSSKFYHEGFVLGSFTVKELAVKFKTITDAGKSVVLEIGDQQDVKVATSQPAGNTADSSCSAGTSNETGVRPKSSSV